jgi:hypothetical protein
MHRNFPVVLVAVLAVTILVAGCSSVQQTPQRLPSKQDPLVGVWVSNQSGSPTFYRFFPNGTFSAWSQTGNIHPKYSFQYSGQWEPRGPGMYVTQGAHIGYGEVTALAIWRELTLVYDPRHDTFSITVHPDQVFVRVSQDPDSPVP